ncbi:MAG: hypothetical protein ABEK84_00105 [Salinibacter sp.]
MLGVAVWVGCDASLDPFGDERGFYSVYGFLSPSGEPHYIRVQDLAEPLTRDSTRRLDVTVKLENLATGRTETLTDSVVRFNGTYTHNFRADQDIRLGTTYRLTVEGEGGRRTRAAATIPRATNVDVSPDSGATCAGSISIGFPRIEKSRFVTLALGLRYKGLTRFVPVDLSGGSGAYVLFLFKPAVLVEEIVPPRKLPYVNCDPDRYCRLLDDRRVRLAYTHFGPDRAPDSIRGNPLSSRVQNGLGNFVGLRRDTVVARLDTKLRCPGVETVPCKPVEPPQTKQCPDAGNL